MKTPHHKGDEEFTWEDYTTNETAGSFDFASIVWKDYTAAPINDAEFAWENWTFPSITSTATTSITSETSRLTAAIAVLRAEVQIARFAIKLAWDRHFEQGREFERAFVRGLAAKLGTEEGDRMWMDHVMGLVYEQCDN